MHKYIVTYNMDYSEEDDVHDSIKLMKRCARKHGIPLRLRTKPRGAEYLNVSDDITFSKGVPLEYQDRVRKLLQAAYYNTEDEQA